MEVNIDITIRKKKRIRKHFDLKSIFIYIEKKEKVRYIYIIELGYDVDDNNMATDDDDGDETRHVSKIVFSLNFVILVQGNQYVSNSIQF